MANGFTLFGRPIGRQPAPQRATSTLYYSSSADRDPRKNQPGFVGLGGASGGVRQPQIPNDPYSLWEFGRPQGERGTVPGFASSRFGNARDYFDLFESQFPEGDPIRGIMQLQMQADADAQADREARVQRAIDTVTGARTRYEQELGGLRTDPNLDLIESSIRERTQPGYNVIGPAEVASTENEIAQAVARIAAARQVAAGGTGQTFSGTTIADDASLRGLGAAQGLRLRADVERSNREARDRAVGELGEFSLGRDRLENDLLDELARVDAAIASLQAGDIFEAPDFLPFEQLRFARDAYTDESRMRERELDLYEQSLQPNAMDWVSMFGELAGTGLLQGVGDWGLRALGRDVP